MAGGRRTERAAVWRLAHNFGDVCFSNGPFRFDGSQSVLHAYLCRACAISIHTRRAASRELMCTIITNHQSSPKVMILTITFILRINVTRRRFLFTVKKRLDSREREKLVWLQCTFLKIDQRTTSKVRTWDTRRVRPML